MSITSIKRYNVVGLDSEYSCESCSLHIVSLEDEAGKYVEFKDHSAEVKQLLLSNIVKEIEILKLRKEVDSLFKVKFITPMG
jgi:hypothetical protein